MSVVLTKLADKFLCSTYKTFLEKRAQGYSLDRSKQFKNNFEQREPYILDFNIEDVGDFLLTNNAIIYMEKRFKNGLIELTDFIAKFIP
nr:MAG TPA: hypothetical protein [Caudoviricetes sp.]